MRDPDKTIGGLIDGAGIAIISSVDADGYPIYFTTNTSSLRVAQHGRYNSDFKSQDFEVE